MAKSIENRRSVRMRLSGGRVTLYHPQLPSMKCMLLDLSEGGARCRTDHDSTPDDFVSSAWRRILGSEKPFHLEVNAPGESGRCRIEATVRHLKIEMDGEVEFGLQFERMDTNRMMLVGKSMSAYAKTGLGTMTGTHQKDKNSRMVDPYAGVPMSARPAEAQVPSSSTAPAPNRPRTSGPFAPVKVATKSSERLPAVATPAAKSSDSGRRSSESGRRSVADVARGLWDSVRGAVGSPRTPSDAAMDAVPASQSQARMQAVDSPANVNFKNMKVGEILQRLGKLKPQKAVEAYDKSREKGQKFGRYLLDAKLVTPADLCRALSLQSGLPIVDLSATKPADSVKTLFPIPLMKQYTFVPFNKNGDIVYVATVTPLTAAALAKLEAACRYRVKVFLAQDDVVATHLKNSFIEAGEEEIEEAEEITEAEEVDEAEA